MEVIKKEIEKDFNLKLSKLKEENEIIKNKIINDDLAKYKDLENKYNILEVRYDSNIKDIRNQITNEYEKKILEMKTSNDLILANKNSEINNLKLSFDNLLNIELGKQKEKFDEELKIKEDMINNLQRAKASLNVKQTGEDLEAWCNNEVSSYMQNGLFNCTWEKDNLVVKDYDDIKGSKADYIFKIYASVNHDEKYLLASICLDMKDENPDSVNKKSNSDYYKQLDKNREKKNCKYSVLVSNLEMDKPNVLPIFKVREYENMYVVRPAYLMTFLNLITSLSTRFQDLIFSKEKENIELLDKLSLIEEFNSIKNTYLDKPLESLEKAIDDILKNSEAIKKACRSIDDSCDKINKSYINQIEEKINRYELKLQRGIIKKIE